MSHLIHAFRKKHTWHRSDCPLGRSLCNAASETAVVDQPRELRVRRHRSSAKEREIQKEVQRKRDCVGEREKKKEKEKERKV